MKNVIFAFCASELINDELSVKSSLSVFLNIKHLVSHCVVFQLHLNFIWVFFY